MVAGMSARNGQVAVWKIRHVGASAVDPAVYTQRSAAVGAGVRSTGWATILVARGQGSPQVFLLAPNSRNAPKLAGSLASAVGGRHEGHDGLPEVDIDAPFVQLFARPNSFAGRDTQAGRDPAEVARKIVSELEEGMWLAVSLRTPSRAEKSMARRWFAHRLAGMSTHYSLSGDALLATFTAGGASVNELSGLLDGVASMLPGFDLEYTVRQPTGRAGLSAAGAGAAGVGWFGSGYVFDHQLLAVSDLHRLGVSLTETQLQYGLTAPGLLVGAAALSGLWPSPRAQAKRQLRRGLYPRPGHKSRLLVKAPRRESHDKEGNTIKASAGTYPLHDNVFLVGPEQVACIASPQYGTVAGAGSTQMRTVPPVLAGPIGPIVGTSNDTLVHLSSPDMWAGVFMSGEAGSGKSVAVQNLFAFDSLERVNPSGRPGFPGRSNALIAFESKGADGVDGYLRWVAATGDTCLLADLADPRSVAVDMVPRTGTFRSRARQFVDRMVYAWGEQSIGAQSYQTLEVVFELSLQVADVDAERAGLKPGSFIDYADIFLCNRGESAGQDLYDAVMKRVADSDDGPQRDQLAESMRKMELLYGTKVTPSQRRTQVSAPKSKVATLASLSSWWSPNRKRISFDKVLNNHWSLIVNTGAPVAGGAVVDDETNRVMSAMLMHTLQTSIKANCVGWRAKQRSVTVFSDELGLLASHSGEVFTWMRNQGRAFGVRLVLATQYPEQLPDEVRTAVMGFSTKVLFRQSNPDVIATALAQLNLSGDTWTTQDLYELERYQAVVQVMVDEKPQPAVPVRMGFWDMNRERFALDHGYAHAA